ncbi:MAG: YdeI/OmpD-associated family protein [Bacteroidales bacterium]
MDPVFFKNKTDFRNCLEKIHLSENELIVGFYKVKTDKFNMSWSESVDVALCFGWIDGIRKSIDNDSYCIRFTPRKPTSIWSAINISKVEALIKKGQMQAAGVAAFKMRKEEKSKIYSFENDIQNLAENYEIFFKLNIKAWDFFISQAPSYRKTAIHWIMAAKQEQTQFSRLEKIVNASENQKRLWGK